MVKKMEEGRFLRGEREGIWTYFDPEGGKPTYEKLWKMGKLIGKPTWIGNGPEPEMNPFDDDEEDENE